MAITGAAATALRDEPGCLVFDVLELGAREHRLAFCEKCRDEAARADEHRSSAHFAAWRAVAEQVLVPGSQVVPRAAVVPAEADLSAPGGPA